MCRRVCTPRIVRTCIYNYVFFLFVRRSASCTHVSALLHALAALNPTSMFKPSASAVGVEDKDEVPVTSLPCKWKPPKVQKESMYSILQ